MSIERPHPAAGSPEASTPERFQWMGQSWDIARLLEDLQSGVVEPSCHVELTADFVEFYARRVLQLGRGASDALVSVMGRGLVHVDLDRAMAMPESLLERRSGILMETSEPNGLIRIATTQAGPEASCILCDGNHLLARAFQLRRGMKAVVVPGHLANNYLVDDRARALAERQGRVRMPGDLKSRRG